MNGVSVTVQRVGTDAVGTATTDDALADLTTAGMNGNIVLESTTGDITLTDGTFVWMPMTPGDAVNANGEGNVRIAALAGSVTAQADVRSADGNLTVFGAQNVAQEAGVDLVTAAGSIDIEGTAGSVTMNDTATAQSASADVRVVAGTDVAIGNLQTATNVSVTAGGAITDAGDVNIDVMAAGLRISANGAGTGTDALDVTVDTLSASVDAGGLFVTETSGITIGDVGATVARVDASGNSATSVSDAAQSDLVGANGGAIVVTATLGDVTLTDGTATADGSAITAGGAGHVRIDAQDGSVLVQASVGSDTGSITLTAAEVTTQSMGTAITSGGAGSIDVTSMDGAFSQGMGATIDGGMGGVRLSASTDLTLWSVATTGDASLIATAGSVEGQADATTLSVGGLRMEAGTTIGAANALQIDATTLSARAGGSVTVTDVAGLTVGDVEVTVQQVGADGLTSAVTDAAQGDVVTTNDGAVTLTVSTGDLTLNDGMASDDDLAIVAGGTGVIQVSVLGGAFAADGGLASTSGDVDVSATGDVVFTDAAGIAAATTETVSITSATGSVSQSATSVVTNTVGDVAITAEGSVLLGQVVTPADVLVTTTTGFASGQAGAALNVDAATLQITSPFGTAAEPVRLAEGLIFIEGLPTTIDVDRLFFISSDDSITFDGVVGCGC